MNVLLEYEEQNVVDSWFTYQFYPYYRTLNIFRGGFFQTNFAFDEVILAMMNRKLSEMCAFRNYIATNPEGFKPNAQLDRVAKVDAEFLVVENEIIQYLNSTGKSFQEYKVNVSTSDFKFGDYVVKYPVQASCINYQIVQKGTQIDNPTLPEFTPIDSPVTVPTTEVPTTTQPTVANEKKSGFNWFWYVLAAYTGYRILK